MGTMREPTVPKLAKWPFLLGDVLLLGAGWLAYSQGTLEQDYWRQGLLVACVALGAFLAVLPYILEYRAAAKLAETDMVAATVSQLQKLDTVATQISSATGLWQNAQDAADKTAAAAQAIADRMTAEARSFTEFIEKANNGEKAALRLELDKFRRAEADWVQVLVRTLDHVYALHQGALKSGQPNLIEQLSRFQHACYDAARRVGLAPFMAAAAEPFDSERHQVLEGDGKAAPNSTVEATIATGFTYQGRVVRPALVRLRGGVAPAKPESAPQNQRDLPLEPNAPGAPGK
jgi:molecular chaperone GrpE (heat shock protein)